MQNYEYEKEVIGDHPEVVLWTDLPFNEWCPQEMFHLRLLLATERLSWALIGWPLHSVVTQPLSARVSWLHSPDKSHPQRSECLRHFVTNRLVSIFQLMSAGNLWMIGKFDWDDIRWVWATVTSPGCSVSDGGPALVTWTQSYHSTMMTRISESFF